MVWYCIGSNKYMCRTSIRISMEKIYQPRGFDFGFLWWVFTVTLIMIWFYNVIYFMTTWKRVSHLMILCEWNPPVVHRFLFQSTNNAELWCLSVVTNRLMTKQYSCLWFKTSWRWWISLLSFNQVRRKFITRWCSSMFFFFASSDNSHWFEMNIKVIYITLHPHILHLTSHASVGHMHNCTGFVAYTYMHV